MYRSTGYRTPGCCNFGAPVVVIPPCLRPPVRPVPDCTQTALPSHLPFTSGLHHLPLRRLPESRRRTRPPSAAFHRRRPGHPPPPSPPLHLRPLPPQAVRAQPRHLSFTSGLHHLRLRRLPESRRRTRPPSAAFHRRRPGPPPPPSPPLHLRPLPPQAVRAQPPAFFVATFLVYAPPSTPAALSPSYVTHSRPIPPPSTGPPPAAVAPRTTATVGPGVEGEAHTRNVATKNAGGCALTA